MARSGRRMREGVEYGATISSSVSEIQRHGEVFEGSRLRICSSSVSLPIVVLAYLSLSLQTALFWSILPSILLHTTVRPPKPYRGP
jgi:hypothetical protein